MIRTRICFVLVDLARAAGVGLKGPASDLFLQHCKKGVTK